MNLGTFRRLAGLYDRMQFGGRFPSASNFRKLRDACSIFQYSELGKPFQFMDFLRIKLPSSAGQITHLPMPGSSPLPSLQRHEASRPRTRVPHSTVLNFHFITNYDMVYLGAMPTSILCALQHRNRHTCRTCRRMCHA